MTWKRIKTIILYALPHVYMLLFLWFRRYQLSNRNTILTINQYEFFTWAISIVIIIFVQILYARNKRMIQKQAETEAVLETARQIQTGLVPPDSRLNEDGINIRAFTQAAREVGGDFYDYFRIDGDHMALVMADVSGKGVPAALFMMRAKTLIETIARPGMGTSEILTRVNDALSEGNDTGHFVTVWLGILELSSGKGVATNAGHDCPLLRRADGLYEVIEDEHSMALGLFEGEEYEEHAFTLNPGDSLFVYTDGVPEATDNKHAFFGMERLTEVLNRRPDASPDAVIEEVRQGLAAFTEGAEQFDDITMLAVQYG